MADDNDDGDFNNNNGSQIVPCHKLDNVPIHTINAESSKIEHCESLRNDYASLSTYIPHEMDTSYTCNLSTAMHCLAREDVTHEMIIEQLDTHGYHTEMAEVPDGQNDFDEGCVPICQDHCLAISDSSPNNQTKKESIEIIDKQNIYSLPEHDNASICWHLYRIKTPNNDDLGIVVPHEGIKLLMFNLYANSDTLTVQLVYIGSIYYKECKTQLEEFCRYIFEEVFDNMNTGSESILKFDFENSTFKLLPCFLTKSGNIDYQRMALIHERKTKSFKDLSELRDDEVYILLNSPDKQFYTNISATSSPTLASDRWIYKKPLNTLISYADYYEYEIDGIRIQRDSLMAAMKRMKKPDENYLKHFPPTTHKKTNTSSTTSSYFPLEVLRYAPLNQTDLQLIYKLPSLLVRISQLYHVEQLGQLLATNIQSYKLLEIDETSVVTFTDCVTRILSSTESNVLPFVSLNYDMLSETNCEHQPSFDLLFQSITRRSAEENTNMEVLESLGDSFLKLAMSMSLYHQYPSADTGILTEKRSEVISNDNLYRLAMNKGLQHYLNSKKIVFCGENANWIPPGYTVDKVNAEKYMEQKLNPKAYADMIEALIGTFLISTDYITTLRFMKWLGLDVIPIDEQDGLVKTPSVLRLNTSNDVDETKSLINKFYNEHSFIETEQIIKYDFKDKAYLIAAFTHPSYSTKALTINYTRLKSIGNVLLEFLVTLYICITKKSVTPGTITNIRQDLLNGSRKADILVAHHLNGKILCNPPKYFDEISSYAAKKRSSMDKNNVNQWADPEAPKALADVFEGLVGAIFLDSNYSLQTVWDVIFPLLRPYIDHIIEHPNIHPVQSVDKQCGETIGYTSDENGNVVCTIILPNGAEIKGLGKSKKKAKHYACKKAKK